MRRDAPAPRAAVGRVDRRRRAGWGAEQQAPSKNSPPTPPAFAARILATLPANGREGKTRGAVASNKQRLAALRGARDPKHLPGKLRVDLRHLWRHDLAKQSQSRGVGRGCDGHIVRPIEVEAGVLDHLVQAVARMQAGEAKAS